MEVIKEEGTWPNLMLSHIKSLLLYIYIYSKSYFIKSYFIPRYKKGEKIIIGGSFNDLMMTGKWLD